MPVVDLDDESKAVFLIPCSQEADQLSAESFDNDFENGPELRWDAYKDAWKKCLDRVQYIVHQLHDPVVKSVSLQVHEAYSQSLPGLPNPELPVITVSNLAGGNRFLNDLNRSLDAHAQVLEPDVFTNHLTPSQCPNLTTGMRTLISGFTRHPPDKTKYTKRPPASLSSYDAASLDAWYQAVKHSRLARNRPIPRLVVILHDFERFDVSVMQDMLYICSLHVPQTPIVFVVSLLSPQSPSYLHVTYPRWVLSALRIQHFRVPSGSHLLERVLLGTFFDHSFQPDLMLGPSVLAYVIDYFERYDSSLDGILHLLKLAHMDHFTSDPFTLMLRETSANKLTASHSFIHELWGRVCLEEDIEVKAEWSVAKLQERVDTFREDMAEAVHAKRAGYELLRVVYEFLQSRGLKRPGLTNLKLATDVLSKRATKNVSDFSTYIKKLKPADVPTLVDIVKAHLRSADEDDQVLHELEQILPEDDAYSGEMRQAAIDLADWFESYLGDLAKPLEDVPMWYIWYTGKAAFPVDLVNPSLRSTVVGGLLRPREFTLPIDDVEDGGGDDDGEETSVADLPDTSVLFRGYLESGRMLNVCDWYESFKGVLDLQKMNGQGKKAKGKGKADKKSEEKWQLECQARFMRALHELDYLGFLKHTGRKADHVLKTVFEIGDDE